MQRRKFVYVGIYALAGLTISSCRGAIEHQLVRELKYMAKKANTKSEVKFILKNLEKDPEIWDAYDEVCEKLRENRNTNVKLGLVEYENVYRYGMYLRQAVSEDIEVSNKAIGILKEVQDSGFATEIAKETFFAVLPKITERHQDIVPFLLSSAKFNNGFDEPNGLFDYVAKTLARNKEWRIRLRVAQCDDTPEQVLLELMCSGGASGEFIRPAAAKTKHRNYDLLGDREEFKNREMSLNQ